MEREEGKKEGRGKYGRSWGWQEIIFLQATTAMEHPSLKSLAEKKKQDHRRCEGNNGGEGPLDFTVGYLYL